MQIDPKLTALLEQAVEEITTSKPAFTNVAKELVTAAFGTVLRAETLFEKRVAGNAEMRAFVGKGRDQVYATLFISHGVTEETTQEILSFLIAP